MENRNNLDGIPFKKMHGLGNDFVVIDSRYKEIEPSNLQIKKISDRRTGIGFDQLLIIKESKHNDAFMSVYNANGSVVETCGNGARCIAKIIMNESKKEKVVIDTLAGPITAWENSNGLISADMGKPSMDWRDIPLSHEISTINLDLRIKNLPPGIAINIGNPHIVFLVKNLKALKIDKIAPQIEHHNIFPENTNVEFVEYINKNHIKMRVWERGVGITQACGTGACAAAVASIIKNLTERSLTVSLDGGDLQIEWLENNNIILSGPAHDSFNGITNDKLNE